MDRYHTEWQLAQDGDDGTAAMFEEVRWLDIDKDIHLYADR